MKILKISLLVAASCALSCTNKADGGSQDGKKDGYIISGKLKNAGADQKIVLEELQTQNFVARDTATIGKDGSFQFKGKVDEPTLYRMNVQGVPGGILLVLENKEIQLEADAKDLTKPPKVKNSSQTEDLLAMSDLLTKSQMSMMQLNQRYQANQGNPDSLRAIEAKFGTLQAQNNQRIKSFMRQHPKSIATAFAGVNVINADEEFAFADSTLAVLNKNLPNSKYTKQLAAKLGQARQVAVGQPAPDIKLSSPEGKEIALSSLRGKYVLIDFWASWCGPCRKENPNVVRMYQQHKGKNFEIFGVSLDQSKEKWVKAIADDKLTWTHVSDLGGWQSSAAALYKVNSIPATFLIDPKGVIIAKNLRGSALEEKLAGSLK